MENFEGYRDDEETEERVQVTQEECENEEEISEAIEKSKRDLKESEVPYGYKKINEKIFTRVYKVPGNKRSHNSYYSNIYNNISNKNTSSIYENNNIFKNYNLGKRRYFYDQYECDPNCGDKYNDYYECRIKNNTYNNNGSSFQKYNNSEQPGTIYNYNTITRNHGYHESESKSPIKKNKYRTQHQTSNVNRYSTNKTSRNIYNYRYNNDYTNRTYNESGYDDNNKKFTNYTQIKGGRIENYVENEISKDGKFLISMTLSKRILDEEEPKPRRWKDYNKGEDMYKNSYYREEVEINNEGDPREYEETTKILNKRVRDYGDNYKYFERNENRSPLKATETRQRRREPIHVYGDEYYETNEEIDRYKYYPIRTEIKTTRYYTNDNYGEDEKY